MVAGCRFDFSHSACSLFSIENCQRASATGRPRQPILRCWSA